MQIDEFIHILRYGDGNIVDKCTYIYHMSKYIDMVELTKHKKIFYFHPSILKSISLCIDGVVFLEEKTEFDMMRDIKLCEWLGGNKPYYVPRKEKLERIMNDG